MTNINCSSNCIYQRDGKCGYELIDVGKVSSSAGCAYFIRTQKNK